MDVSVILGILIALGIGFFILRVSAKKSGGYAHGCGCGCSCSHRHDEEMEDEIYEECHEDRGCCDDDDSDDDSGDD